MFERDPLVCRRFGRRSATALLVGSLLECAADRSQFGEDLLEDVFHRSDLEDAVVRFDRGYDTADEEDPLAEPRGHRAIGVVYDPDFESGNYVRTVLPDRYDAFVHLEETEALHPQGLEGRKTPPETYPWRL